MVARLRAERRRFLRVRVDISGRLFVPSENREERCRIVDMSPGGALVACEHVPPADAPIVLYIDGFGRFEGVVARPSENSFGVHFQCSALKRERVAEQLTMLVNKGSVDEAVLRRHERSNTRGLAQFTRANGDNFACEVLDLSLSGLSIKTEARPPIGEIVVIGQMAGKVVRYHESGIAIEFVGGRSEDAVPQISIQRQ